MQLLQPFRCRQPALFPAVHHVPHIRAHTIKGWERMLVQHSRNHTSIQGQDFCRNEVVSGVVHNITPYGAFVDMNGVIGLLHISQISSERVASVDQVLKVGDEIKAMVHYLDEEQQKIGLSTKKLEPEPGDMLRDPQRVYEQAESTAAAFEEGLERGQETEQLTKQRDRDSNIDVFHSLRKHEVVTGVVQELKPYGVFVDIGPLALLHISQITGVRITQETLEQHFKVGDQVKAMVMTLDKETYRTTLSTKALELEAGEMMEDRQRVYDEAQARAAAFRETRERALLSKQKERDEVFESLRLNHVVAGVVQDLRPYGALVDVGSGTRGLLHISEVTHDRLNKMQRVFKVGDQVKAMVLNMDEERDRFTLSTKVLEKEPGEMLTDRQRVFDEAEARAAAFREGLDVESPQQQEAKQPMEQTYRDQVYQRPRRYDVVAGVVKDVQPYGAFVDLGGGIRALLHISQVTHDRVVSMQEVFKAGDQVKAMVLNMDEERNRLTLCTKKLEKEHGEMMVNRQRVYDEAEARAAAYRERLSEGP